MGKQNTRCLSPPMHRRRKSMQPMSYAYLRQVTGAEFQRVEKVADGKPVIAVGSAAAVAVDATTDLTDLGPEGILLHKAGKSIILTGGQGAPRGTLYAVYTFLEDFIGVQWWTPEVTEVPKQPNLYVELQDLRYSP